MSQENKLSIEQLIKLQTRIEILKNKHMPVNLIADKAKVKPGMLYSLNSGRPISFENYSKILKAIEECEDFLKDC